jgi:ATP-dependent Clp protease ATP-binding subunit ClpX
MKSTDEKIPSPSELEKEIGDFLAKKFGQNVKVSMPMVLPQTDPTEVDQKTEPKREPLQFDLKPEELVAYLDQFLVKQDQAKAILATKICTHFNRIKLKNGAGNSLDLVGGIKNNVLMMGPTGVGKTYMIRLIAKKIGVPFVKGDATKFSETGYVGGDVEDLVRDLVREADDDIELAQCGIIYIDEIDKIASSRNLIGADVSRSGVQRALLKPLEETDVELKVPHDPISMIQEVERFRKTGKRDKTIVNTKNILFIMSGAFGDLTDIIGKRVQDQSIGFGATIIDPQESSNLLVQVKSDDLITYGFESEFVGRLPVRAVFEQLNQNDLFEILKNPNNPIILSKKLDFKAYGIDIKFSDEALKHLARLAASENTGARGLVSAIEQVLLPFEKKLPSTQVAKFPVTKAVTKDPQRALERLLDPAENEKIAKEFTRIAQDEIDALKTYLESNQTHLAAKHNLTLTPSRIELIAQHYAKKVMDVSRVVKNIKSFYDQTKQIELYFYKNHDINVVLEDDAIDYIIETGINTSVTFDDMYQKFCTDFELGLKLAREKTGRSRFYITRKALLEPEDFIRDLIKEAMTGNQLE